MNPDRLDPGSHEHDHSVIPTRPLDQAPAADLALDALDRLLRAAVLDAWTSQEEDRADAATIRDALADRITPAEARAALRWAEHIDAMRPGTPLVSDERALIARLGKIAEAGR